MEVLQIFYVFLLRRRIKWLGGGGGVLAVVEDGGEVGGPSLLSRQCPGCGRGWLVCSRSCIPVVSRFFEAPGGESQYRYWYRNCLALVAQEYTLNHIF